MSLKSLVISDPSLPAQFLLAAGVAITANLPIGSVSILTIQRAMSLGFKRAFLPTLGAMVGNGTFGIIAALGSGYVSSTLTGSRTWLRLIAAVILIYIGTRLLIYRKDGAVETKENFGLPQLALLKLTLVLTNPLTLGFYIVAFTAMGLHSSGLVTGESFALGGGVVFGVAAWFLVVCSVASRFHMRLNDAILVKIRKGVGLLFIILSLVSIGSVLIPR